MSDEQKTELEKFRELAKHVIHVPKKEIDKLERKRKKRNPRKRKK